QHHPRRQTDARQNFAHHPRRHRRLRRPALALYRHPLPLPGHRARLAARLPGDHRRERRWGNHGRASQGPAGLRCAVPSRIDTQRARPRPAAQLPEHLNNKGILMTISLTDALARCIEHREIFHEEMLHLLRMLMRGEMSPDIPSALIIGLRVKKETIGEITAAAQVMREFALQVQTKDPDELLDMCGTGGDGTKTFNISTAAMFVAAAAGAKIAKHGGRSASSSSGSADVVEALGVNINLTPEQINECIEATGIGFMFAPAHHGAMKNVAPLRKELGVKTIFNILGPLTNPANASNQLMGVFHSDLVGIQVRVLQRLGSKHVLIVHGKDGMDEASLGAPTLVGELKDGKISEYEIHP